MWKWNDKKQKAKQHICDGQGNSYCKVENGTKKPMVVSESMHESRPVCSICVSLKDRGVEPAGRMSNSEAGERQSKWRDPFLHTWEWKAVRYGVLAASNGKCQLCGRGSIDGVILNVDHVLPRRQRPDLALTATNLQVLCSACNHGKGNRSDDRREASG